MHLGDEQIQRTLHDELGPARAVVDRHLAECAECRLRIAEARLEEEWVFDLLRESDPATTDIDAETIPFEARRRNAVAWGQWAAGLVFAAVLAGAAYTAPGSPVPVWLERAGAWLMGAASRDSLPHAVAPTPTPSGIAVLPSPRFSIRFETVQTRGIAAVTLTAGPHIVVRTVNGTATFSTDVDQLTIDNRGSTADYEIELPNDAPRVEIAVGNRRLLLKEGASLDAEGTPDRQGRYLLPLSTTGN